MRLDRMNPDQMIRIIVVLSPMSERREPKVRLTKHERDKKIEEMKRLHRPVLAEIDAVLDRFGGSKSTRGMEALGCVLVETTAAGIEVLALIANVKAIMEDQPISLRV